jgi:esterase/lipase
MLQGLLARGARGLRRIQKRSMFSLLAMLPVVWPCLDLGYALVTQQRYAHWETGMQRDADGVRLGCREFTVGSGDYALLFIHGFGDSPAVFQRMAPALAARGFTCRAMRLPYFAMPLESYRQTTAAQWREAVKAELAALRANHTHVAIVAHSLGAAVALDDLAEPGEDVNAVIFLTPLVEVSAGHSPLLPPRAWHQLLDHALVFTDCVGLPAEPELANRSAAGSWKGDPFVPLGVFREMFDLVDRNRTRGAVVRQPLYLALAEHDSVIDNQAAERLFAASPSSRKHLRYVAGAGHVLPLDHGWSSLVNDIARFCEW